MLIALNIIKDPENDKDLLNFLIDPVGFLATVSQGRLENIYYITGENPNPRGKEEDSTENDEFVLKPPPDMKFPALPNEDTGKLFFAPNESQKKLAGTYKIGHGKPFFVRNNIGNVWEFMFIINTDQSQS